MKATKYQLIKIIVKQANFLQKAFSNNNGGIRNMIFAKHIIENITPLFRHHSPQCNSVFVNV